MPIFPFPRSLVVLEELYAQCTKCLAIAERVAQRDGRRFTSYLRLAEGTITFDELKRRFDRLGAANEEMRDQYIPQIEALWPYCDTEQVARAKYLHTFGGEAAAEGFARMQIDPWFEIMIPMGYAMAARGQLMRVDLLRKLEAELVNAINKQPTKPIWNRDTGNLMFQDQIVRNVRALAVRVRPILDAFEAEGWPAKVDAPPGLEDQSLREAIAQLNKGMKMIRFQADGTTRGVVWQVR